MADIQTGREKIGKTGLEAGQGCPGRGAAKAGGQDNANWQACQAKKAGINREKGIGR
jgi:hypothetical protein